MTAAPAARPSHTVILSGEQGPLLLFENGAFTLGPGWEPDKAGRAFLAWVNATYQKELARG